MDEAEVVEYLEEALAPQAGAVERGIVVASQQGVSGLAGEGVARFCRQVGQQGADVVSRGGEEWDQDVDDNGIQAAVADEGDRGIDRPAAPAQPVFPESRRGCIREQARGGGKPSFRGGGVETGKGIME